MDLDLVKGSQNEKNFMKADSNGVITTIQPHGWSWVDQPLVGATSNGLNVYAITVPQSISNCYRKRF